MQILHAGRYGYHQHCLAPSALRAPINSFKPKMMTAADVRHTVDDYIRCAELARQAGYDGIEIMGSEGYLINQFLVRKTNHRDDEWGGDFAKRARFAVEIVQGIRACIGVDCIMLFRLSMIDLVRDGSSWEEVVTLARMLEKAGVTMINTGID